MTGKTHLTVAAATAVILYATTAPQTPAPELIGVATLAGLGGLLPDIDHKNSKISQSMKVTSAITRAISSHRGLFHTPLLWAIVGYLMTLAPYAEKWAPAVLIGIFSHLFLDMLNPMGIPLLWPAYRKKIHLLKIKTGGAIENVICVAFPIACATYFLTI